MIVILRVIILITDNKYTADSNKINLTQNNDNYNNYNNAKQNKLLIILLLIIIITA